MNPRLAPQLGAAVQLRAGGQRGAAAWPEAGALGPGRASGEQHAPGHSPAVDRQELAEAPCPRAEGWSPTAGGGRSPAAPGLGAEGG